MMKTQHGVKMSPRMERLWRYIREERKISLTDFSTDQCVERELPRLREAMANLEKRQTAKPSTETRHMMLDLAAIMRRLPSARTDSDGAVKDKATTVERGNDLDNPLAHAIEFE